MNTDELCNIIEGLPTDSPVVATQVNAIFGTVADLKALVRERNHLRAQNEHLQGLRDELKAQLEAMHLKHGLPRRRWAP